MRSFIFVSFFVSFSFLFSTLSVSAKTLIFQSQDEPSRERSSPDASNRTPSLTSQANGSQANSSSAAIASTESTVSTESTASGNSQLFFMLEQLQLEVRQMRGLLEEQANQLNHLQRNSKSRYRDIDSRVLELSKKMNAFDGGIKASSSPSTNVSTSSLSVPGLLTPVSTRTEIPKSSVTQGVENAVVNNQSDALLPTEDQTQAYQQAYSLIKNKKFEQAVVQLNLFIEKYPRGTLTGNAYYWLGEVYLALPQLEQARQAFSVVVSDFPDHRKVADALFKLGVCYDRLQQRSQSEKYLSEVQVKFPKSTAAKLAKSYKINR